MTSIVNKTLKGNRSGTEPVLLSELIEAVKLDLVESAKRKSPLDEPLFWVSEAIVETEVVAERKVGAGGKMDVFLVAVSGDAEQTNATKHKVSVKLTSITQGGELSTDSPLLRGVAKKHRDSK